MNLDDVDQLRKPDFMANPHKYFTERTGSADGHNTRLPALAESNELLWLLIVKPELKFIKKYKSRSMTHDMVWYSMFPFPSCVSIGVQLCSRHVSTYWNIVPQCALWDYRCETCSLLSPVPQIMDTLPSFVNVSLIKLLSFTTITLSGNAVSLDIHTCKLSNLSKSESIFIVLNVRWYNSLKNINCTLKV